MFLVSEEVFAEVCADQGVQLNDEFAVEASWTKDDLDFPYRDYYMPTDMIEHAAWAGRILRRHPDEKLATGVIKVADTPLAEDLAARLVVGMINDSIEHPEPALGAISKIDTDSKRVGTCETAEPQFVATLMHIAKVPYVHVSISHARAASVPSSYHTHQGTASVAYVIDCYVFEQEC